MYNANAYIEAHTYLIYESVHAHVYACEAYCLRLYNLLGVLSLEKTNIPYLSSYWLPIALYLRMGEPTNRWHYFSGHV